MPSPAWLLRLAGLVAAVAAVELGVDDVPILCTNICGPMVELTSICNTDDLISATQRRIRRTLDEVHDVPLMDQEPRRRSLLDGIAALAAADTAPTTIRTVPRPASSTRPIGTFRIIPASTAANPATTQLAPPPQPLVAAPTRPGIAWTESSTGAVAAAAAATSMMYRPDQKLAGVKEEAASVEAQCVCLNKSFDVRSVAALCASCILQRGDKKSREFCLARPDGHRL